MESTVLGSAVLQVGAQGRPGDVGRGEHVVGLGPGGLGCFEFDLGSQVGMVVDELAAHTGLACDGGDGRLSAGLDGRF